MYCEYCGRKFKKRCNCIHTNKIGNIEVYSILFFSVSVSALIFAYALKLNDFVISEFPYFQSGSISLSIIITVLLVVSLVFKRNYITIFFGCHQKCNRTLKFKDSYFVICARCTGIFVGIYFSMFLFVLKIPSLWFMILAIPMLYDGIRQYKTKYVSNNSKRIITGILFGPALVLIYSLSNYLVLYIATLFVL